MKLTPQSLSQLIKEQLEVVLTNDEAVEVFGDQITEEGQLELPGMEMPLVCEPADGVDDLSTQLAQLVIDSNVLPEEFNDLLELVYDKVAENLEEVGIEDEDDYRRTTMGFMEALRANTLDVLTEWTPPDQEPIQTDLPAAAATDDKKPYELAGPEVKTGDTKKAATTDKPAGNWLSRGVEKIFGNGTRECRRELYSTEDEADP